MTIADAETIPAEAVPTELENPAVFQLDLGAHGIAIDLTDPDWHRCPCG